ncbi:MAG: DMT family transporter [Ruminococcaceae bacterium]|nr:DMT family transporter [Oscillospiraceae bacterium]
MKKTSAFTTFLLFLTAMIWGFAFVAQVDGVQYVGPLTLNGTRFALGALSLIPVVLIFERGRTDRSERLRTLRASVLAGCALFAASTLQQIGIEYTRSAGVAGFITGLYIVLVPIAGFLLFRHKTGVQVWIGALCAVTGLFLLCLKPDEGFSFGLGELLLLIGALFWTAHILIIDRVAKELRPLHFAWGQFCVCAILGVAAMLLFEQPSVEGILHAKWSILYCGILSVGVAYTLQVVAQRRADPTFATIVMSTESVFSAIGGVLFGIDRISWVGYVGCGLIFAGILLSQLSVGKRKLKKPNAEDTDCPY